LGRIDIYLEVMLLSSYNARPSEGHMDQVFHIFAYLKKFPKRSLLFDDNLPDIAESDFLHDVDWKGFHGEIHESVPENVPPSRGKAVQIFCFVDSDHAGNQVTR
jgi:hypothetical protein